jgi:hypothetical protein
LTLIKTVVPNSYLGKEIKHFAHKADVLRLLAMKYSGGVYLDIDMFVWVTSLINRADRVESSLLTICSGFPRRLECKLRRIPRPQLSNRKVYV